VDIEVEAAAQGDVDVGPLHAVRLDLGDPCELLGSAVSEDGVPQLLGEELNLGQPTCGDHRLDDPPGQRVGVGLAHGDHHALTRADLRGVLDEDPADVPPPRVGVVARHRPVSSSSR
jgi:hypothetical protein